jgi:hypothetical protein
MSEKRSTFIKQPPFDLKLYLNGFPKSGLHLLALMVRPILTPVAKDSVEIFPGVAAGWSGTHKGNSWKADRVPVEWVTFKIGRCGPGQSIRGHGAYDLALANFLWLMGIGHVFIYRDLRDVAVSQAYHIMRAAETGKGHPDPQMFLDLGGFDEMLEAVIVGLGEYPGVLDRWQEYTPWLDVDWTLKVRFEDLLNRPEEMAEIILRYTFARSPSIYAYEMGVEEGPWLLETVNAMAETSQRTELSSTFRKGQTGEWQTHFTERHVRLFKEHDKENWICRLGYEVGEDW